jgi:fatty aldehyde-generating acyl-ACP reductase
MERFAFIVHPIDVRNDAARSLPIARYLPERALEWYMLRREPLCVAHVTGVRGTNCADLEGWFIGCPLSPRQFLQLPVELVYEKLERCGHIAEDLGAGIIGLGAFSSVAGDGGITLAQRLRIPVTTGNSYTVATAVEGAARGAELMGIAMEDATVAVIGATGSIGATCAEIMGRSAREIVLIGRDAMRLERRAERLRSSAPATYSTATDIAAGLRDADVVIAVSSAAQAIVEPHHIKRGAVVCDVARPRDVSVKVSKVRDDVLVIEGGLVRVPGDMRCTVPRSDEAFSFGFPPGTAYACMSETMALALAGRYESFTLGKEVTVEQVDGISSLCRDLGFRLEGFRSFERAVSEEEIARVRERRSRAVAGRAGGHEGHGAPSGRAGRVVGTILGTLLTASAVSHGAILN